MKMWIFLFSMIIMHNDEQSGEDSDEAVMSLCYKIL